MKRGKFLALDYGKKRIGVATGEADFGMAFPRSVIKNISFELVIDELKDLCEELDVGCIVVGLPLNMDHEDEENEITKEVKKFTDKLQKAVGEIEVVLFDERLSTFEAKELMRRSAGDGDKKLLGKDAYSAQIILQRFFDKDEN